MQSLGYLEQGLSTLGMSTQRQQSTWDLAEMGKTSRKTLVLISPLKFLLLLTCIYVVHILYLNYFSQAMIQLDLNAEIGMTQG